MLALIVFAISSTFLAQGTKVPLSAEAERGAIPEGNDRPSR